MNYTVLTSRGSEVKVDADRVETNDTQAKVTFYNGDDVVASFSGYQGFYPTSGSVTPGLAESGPGEGDSEPNPITGL